MKMSKLGMVMAVMLLVTAAAGCASAWPREGTVAGPRGQVVLPSGKVLDVEVADTPELLERGYMFRERISDAEGMVFLMGSVDFHSFWMKNCKVSLDILWLNEKWEVVHMEKKLPPCKRDPCPSYRPLQASLYVLEVKAGLAAAEGIKLGDRITYIPPGGGPSGESPKHR
jgi:uncharacterized protein